jgi:hypothetical protein
MINILLGLEYLTEAAEAAALIQSFKPTSPSDYANLASQIALIFDPALASNADFQTSQKLLATLAAAEAGTTGQISVIPIQSHGNDLAITVTVGPAA